MMHTNRLQVKFLPETTILKLQLSLQNNSLGFIYMKELLFTFHKFVERSIKYSSCLVALITSWSDLNIYIGKHKLLNYYTHWSITVQYFNIIRHIKAVQRVFSSVHCPLYIRSQLRQRGLEGHGNGI